MRVNKGRANRLGYGAGVRGDKLVGAKRRGCGDGPGQGPGGGDMGMWGWTRAGSRGWGCGDGAGQGPGSRDQDQGRTRRRACGVGKSPPGPSGGGVGVWGDAAQGDGIGWGEEGDVATTTPPGSPGCVVAIMLPEGVWWEGWSGHHQRG